MATTLVSTQPVWQAVIATACGARLSRTVWAGMALAVCGAAVAAGRDWQGGTSALLGDLLALVGAVALAGYTAFSQRARTHTGTSVHSALGRVQATTVSVALLLEPPVAALLAWLWLDQVPAGPAWAGLGLIMAGVSVVVISDARSMKTVSGVLDDGGQGMLISLPVIALDETAMNEMHALVGDTAHSGRHDEAARIARTLESSAVRAHGVGSPQATRWIEVQAVLARLEGAPHRACVDRAYHEWSRVEDTSALYDLAPSLLLLHAQVPGHRPEMADAVRRRLKRRGIAVPTVPA